MSEKKKEEKIKKIREYISKSGFPTEIEIGNILRKSGWIVVNQWPYSTKDGSKIRSVDVFAMKLRPQPSPSVLLLLECKKSLKHEWVFHTQEKEDEFLPYVGSFAYSLEMIRNAPFSEKIRNLSGQEIMASKLRGFHLLDRAIKIGVFNVTPSSKVKDDFYEATMQITSALESMDKTFSKLALVFPAIVFDGEIFEFYQKNSETMILPINHLQFLTFSNTSSGVSPCMIDVVRKTYFSEFLRVIERDLHILAEMAEPLGV